MLCLLLLLFIIDWKLNVKKGIMADNLSIFIIQILGNSVQLEAFNSQLENIYMKALTRRWTLF